MAVGSGEGSGSSRQSAPARSDRLPGQRRQERTSPLSSRSCGDHSCSLPAPSCLTIGSRLVTSGPMMDSLEKSRSCYWKVNIHFLKT